MRVKREIFKEYDIRGKCPTEFNPEVASFLGKKFPAFLGNKKNKTIVVGRDLRKNSGAIAEGLISGLLAAGAKVIDLGRVTTPMLYFAVVELGADGGAMVTASHNPQSHNGLKLTRHKAIPVGAQELQSFYNFSQKGGNDTPPKTHATQVVKLDISKKYFDAVFGNTPPLKSSNIAIDGGSGAAKLFLPEIKKRLKIKTGKRPLLFVSFDYDADRLIVRDENKKVVRGDVIGAIVYDNFAKKKDEMVYDLRCSLGVVKYFTNKGIRVIPSRVGHYNIKKAMRENKSVFGIELTGHYYFKEFEYCESSFLGLRKLLEQLAKNPGTKVTDLFRPFGSWYHSGTIDLKINNTNQVIDRLKKFYKRGAQNYLDGLTVEFPSRWWFNIRPSHTESLVRLVAEANTPKLLKEKIGEIKGLINPK